MHKPKLVLENETHKIIWNFETQTDHLIPPKKPDLVYLTKKKKKRTYRLVSFVVSVDHWEKIKESDRKILRPYQGTKKKLENVGDSDISWSWCTWNGPQRVGKGIRNSRKSEEESRPFSIVKIS